MGRLAEKSVCFITDAIENLIPEKDSSIALMQEAQIRGYKVYQCEISDIFLKDNRIWANVRSIVMIGVEQSKTPKKWGKWGDPHSMQQPLHYFSLVWMRKDPPVDLNYLYCVSLLEIAENQGVPVFNSPKALKLFNEKLLVTHFPQCTVPCIVTSLKSTILEFLEIYDKIVLKPLDSMGGNSVFIVQKNDTNLPVIIETITQNATRNIMAQQYIPEIKTRGDKRILIIKGKIYPFALARFPNKADFRGNLAMGATGKGVKVTSRDKWIAEEVGEFLLSQGIVFAGLDIIGDYLTEVNITSPTCLRQIEDAFNVRIAPSIWDGLLQY